MIVNPTILLIQRSATTRMYGRKIPTLLELCVQTAIDNVRYLGDVGETDIDLLGEILPHCTADQLMHIEKSSIVCSKNFQLIE